jgi:hypothetical protein
MRRCDHQAPSDQGFRGHVRYGVFGNEVSGKSVAPASPALARERQGLRDPHFEDAMKAFEHTRRKYRDALKELASLPAAVTSPM